MRSLDTRLFTDRAGRCTPPRRSNGDGRRRRQRGAPHRVRARDFHRAWRPLPEDRFQGRDFGRRYREVSGRGCAQGQDRHGDRQDRALQGPGRNRLERPGATAGQIERVGRSGEAVTRHAGLRRAKSAELRFRLIRPTGFAS